MNREEALRVLVQIGPSLGGDSHDFLRAIVRQAAELIASEATKTDRGPLKGLRGDVALTMNGRPVDQAEAA